LQAFGADVGVSAGGTNRLMAQQGLDEYQVGAGVEQVGGKAMPQRVWRAVLAGQAGPGAGPTKDAAYRSGGNGACGVPAREKPGRGPVDKPVAAEDGEQAGREHGETILAAFAVADPQDHALRINVRDVEVAGLADTQSRRIAGHEHGTILGRFQGIEQGGQFLGGKNLWQSATRTPGHGEVRDHAGLLQRDNVKKLQGGANLPIGVMAAVLNLDVMQQELANLGFPQFCGRALEEGGKSLTVEQVNASRAGPEPAEDEVLFHAVT
jgi:hypothetical protein